MSIKIKTIRGRGYYYNDVSTRVDGKVVTKSTYLSPVNPRRVRQVISGGHSTELEETGASYYQFEQIELARLRYVAELEVKAAAKAIEPPAEQSQSAPVQDAPEVESTSPPSAEPAAPEE